MQRTVKLAAASGRILRILKEVTKKGCMKVKAANNFLYGPTDYRASFEYNVRVARELIKQVWVQERLRPPSFAEIEQTYRIIPQYMNLSYFYSLSQKQWIQLGIYSLQVYGFFKVGEILGRRHLVGYKIQ